MEDGRSLVPMHALFENLNADVKWDQRTRTITSTKGDTRIVLKPDVKQAAINGETVTLDVPPKMVNYRTLIPTRFITEALDYRIIWNHDTQQAIVEAEDKIIKINVAKESQQGKINAVNESTGTNELLHVLSDLGIQNIAGIKWGNTSDNNLAEEYYNAISAATTKSRDQIQDVIDQVNIREITAELETAEKVLTYEALEKANVLILAIETDNAYVYQELRDRYNAVKELIDVNVNVQRDNSSFILYLAINAVPGIENVVRENEYAYKSAIEDKGDNFQFTSIEQLQEFVNNVNDRVAVDTYRIVHFNPNQDFHLDLNDTEDNTVNLKVETYDDGVQMGNGSLANDDEFIYIFG